MLKDNLILLRGLHGFSQEEISEKIGISRQAYAKWESGATVPDIVKCDALASVYGVTLDCLMRSESAAEEASLSAPKGKNIWGSVTVNDRGQIVIPKGARDLFAITGGTRLIVLSDEEGIAMVRAETFEENWQKILELSRKTNSAEEK